MRLHDLFLALTLVSNNVRDACDAHVFFASMFGDFCVYRQHTPYNPFPFRAALYVKQISESNFNEIVSETSPEGVNARHNVLT